MYVPKPTKKIKPQELVKKLTNLTRRQFLGRGLSGVAGAASKGLPVGTDIITGALSGKGGLPQELVRKYLITQMEEFAETDEWLYNIYEPILKGEVPQFEGKPMPQNMQEAERKALSRTELQRKFKGVPTKTFEHSADEYGRQIKESMNLDETGWEILEGKLEDTAMIMEDNEIDRLRDYQRILESNRDSSSPKPPKPVEGPSKPVPEQKPVERPKPPTEPQPTPETKPSTSPRLTRTASPKPELPSGRDLSRIALRGAATAVGWPLYAASFGIPTARSGESQVLAELADQPGADVDAALQEYRQKLARQQQELSLREATAMSGMP